MNVDDILLKYYNLLKDLKGIEWGRVAYKCMIEVFNIHLKADMLLRYIVYTAYNIDIDDCVSEEYFPLDYDEEECHTPQMSYSYFYNSIIKEIGVKKAMRIFKENLPTVTVEEFDTIQLYLQQL